MSNPKCELPKVIIRHNVGPISAAEGRLLLLGQCHCLHRSSAGPTTAAFFDCLNLPTFSRNLAQCRPYTKPIVIFTMASSYERRRARVGLMDGTLLGHVSLLPRQTILEVRKPELGTALARCCAKNKCWRPEFGPELAAKCIPELSFQQRHDIGSWSSANFWRYWASVGPYLTSHLGYFRSKNAKKYFTQKKCFKLNLEWNHPYMSMYIANYFVSIWN